MNTISIGPVIKTIVSLGAIPRLLTADNFDSRLRFSSLPSDSVHLFGQLQVAVPRMAAGRCKVKPTGSIIQRFFSATGYTGVLMEIPQRIDPLNYGKHGVAGSD